MRAVLARGPFRFATAELPEPEAPDGGRVFTVEATGVCAADRMLWDGTGPWPVHWPFTPGHEILARDPDTGERYALEVKVPCGQCRYCAAGRTNLCPRGRHFGSDLPGGFAERIAVPAGAKLHRVPETLDRAEAVLAEPMACAVHAVRRAEVAVGDTVAVIGLGPVGALVVHAALSRSAGSVFAMVRNGYKAELARALGAEPVSLDKPAAAAGADVVVECSGDPDAVDLAIRLAAPGGRVCLYSVYSRPSTVDFNLVAEFKELTLRGGHLAPDCFPEAIALLSSLPPGLLVTAEHPLAALDRALGPSAARRVKEVVIP